MVPALPQLGEMQSHQAQGQPAATSKRFYGRLLRSGLQEVCKVPNIPLGTQPNVAPHLRAAQVPRNEAICRMALKEEAPLRTESPSMPRLLVFEDTIQQVVLVLAEIHQCDGHPRLRGFAAGQLRTSSDFLLAPRPLANPGLLEFHAHT